MIATRPRKNPRRNSPSCRAALLDYLEPRLLLSAVSVQLIPPNGHLQIGTPATFTALVLNQFGQPLAGQSVVLLQQPTSAANLTAVVHNGFALFTWTPLTAGPHRLAADLPPQGDFTATASPWLDVSVGRAASTLNLTVSAVNNTLQFTVAAQTNLPLIPSGTVSIFDGQNLLGSMNLSSSATLTFSVAPGLHKFTAVYAGDAAFLPAQAARSFDVPNPAPIPPRASAAVLAVPNAASTDAAAPSAGATAAPAVTTFVTLPTLSNPQTHDSLLLAQQNAFGLQLPEFRQFYESQPPQLLTSDQVQLVAMLEANPL